jgi:hypothetical protein
MANRETSPHFLLWANKKLQVFLPIRNLHYSQPPPTSYYRMTQIISDTQSLWGTSSQIEVDPAEKIQDARHTLTPEESRTTTFT